MASQPQSRDNAPAYLAKYQARQAAPQAEVDYSDPNVPSYLLKARERSAERAKFEQITESGPPVNSMAWAAETVAPRELDMPDPIRRHLEGSVDVRLIRHGQTQGYVTDAALTLTGRWQAHRKGQDLAKGLSPGTVVKMLHAPTPRAEETCVGVREGIMQALARFGIEGVEVGEPTVAAEFNNFQMWCDGKEMDVTAGFQTYANIYDQLMSSGAGKHQGWITEIDRFWKIQAAGGDPITHWINHPTQYVEPASLVVRRWWKGIVKYVAEGPVNQRMYVCSHSGPIRAMAATSVGHDPGEPNNVEDVRIRVLKDLKRAIVTYRGRGVEIEIPTNQSPSWFRGYDEANTPT
jgi:broad specificity phosphatase PhoE